MTSHWLPHVVFPFLFVSVCTKKLRKAYYKFTRKWKVKINTTVRNEASNPVSSIFKCFIQGFSCSVWVSRQVGRWYLGQHLTCQTNKSLRLFLLPTFCPSLLYDAPLELRTTWVWQSVSMNEQSRTAFSHNCDWKLEIISLICCHLISEAFICLYFYSLWSSG